MDALLETPCIVVDYQKLRANIRRMQADCRRLGCDLRPHIKTHKSVEIARLQMAEGAAGITCAKVSEAEVMAAGGLTDIFIAYPLVGASKIERALRLAQRTRRLILAVDSLACAEPLSREAVRLGMTVEVRIEIDTGKKRTGVPIADAVSLSLAVNALPGLRLTGIFTFKSLLYQGAPTLDAALAAREECELLDGVRRGLAERGLAIRDVSAGSTPTGLACAETGLATEVRPGTYVFYDQTNLIQGACMEEDVAAHIYATVVSAPTPYHAVIDGGSKTFPTDVQLHEPPHFFHSYAYVQSETTIHGRPHLRLDRLSEEHGILTAEGGGETGLSVGEVLRLVPAHICPAVNLQNHIYLDEGGGHLRKIPVDARGMVY